jgi:hypothetical protein
LSDAETNKAIKDLDENIEAWIEDFNKVLDKKEINYFRHHMFLNFKSPFGQFYVLYKIHKGMKDGRWPTRPVCSDVSSLPHGLGKWISEMLLPIARAQPSYFKDSFVLKDLLMALGTLPSNATLFTSDATSMYTNIKTDPALTAISAYLQDPATQKTFHTTMLMHSLQH